MLVGTKRQDQIVIENTGQLEFTFFILTLDETAPTQVVLSSIATFNSYVKCYLG